MKKKQYIFPYVEVTHLLTANLLSMTDPSTETPAEPKTAPHRRWTDVF